MGGGRAIKTPSGSESGWGSLAPPGSARREGSAAFFAAKQAAIEQQQGQAGDARSAALPTSSRDEYAESHPIPPNEWGATVESVSGSTAVVQIVGDPVGHTISVPIEVAGVTADDNVIITFRDNGGVALTAIIQ